MKLDHMIPIDHWPQTLNRNAVSYQTTNNCNFVVCHLSFPSCLTITCSPCLRHYFWHRWIIWNRLKNDEQKATKDWKKEVAKKGSLVGGFFQHIFQNYAQVRLDHFAPKFRDEKFQTILSCHHPEVDDSKVQKLQEVVPYLEMHQVAVDPLPPGEPQACHLRFWGVNPCRIQHGTNWTTLENQHLEPKVMEVLIFLFNQFGDF